MQNREDIPKIVNPVLHPDALVDDEDLKKEPTEEEKEADVVPEDFEHFNLDAADKLAKKDEEDKDK
ncbi:MULTISPECIES: hypothetical protein [unclassified Jeotgalibaca]|uniref:hypothetical protein n=1 Tax=unclassified Jeotgalibaca TaxID=2621505 RepID=UPI003FD13995